MLQYWHIVLDIWWVIFIFKWKRYPININKDHYFFRIISKSRWSVWSHLSAIIWCLWTQMPLLVPAPLHIGYYFLIAKDLKVRTNYWLFMLSLYNIIILNIYPLYPWYTYLFCIKNKWVKVYRSVSKTG